MRESNKWGGDDAYLSDELDAAQMEIKQLREGLRSRTVIGQAEGILMERLGIDSDQAFEYLKRASSHLNRKIVDVAEEILQTRNLPSF